MTDDTGRIVRPLTPTARRIVFGDTADHDIDTQLHLMTEVDLAHVVGLVERGLLTIDRAAPLLARIVALRREDFAPLRGQAAPRGLYLLYEDHLIRQLGAEAGGNLHIGRSRNDLNATVLLLRLRERVDELLGAALRLQAILLRRAAHHANLVMPIYTHFQPAVPITYGHYLLGVATALERDLVGIEQATDGLRTSPLGAGAVGGTDLPLDPGRTAYLLGFDRAALNSIDAVASRDTALRILFAATTTALTVGRLVTDLQLWSSQEFGLLTFPDELVGSSSIMPQKRNVFLAEHVKAKPALVFAAAQTLVMAAKGVPFTNSIEVGTEGVSGVWSGLDAATDALVLTRLLVRAAVPDADRMSERARDGQTGATAMANRLVRAGVPFRTAHHRIGALARQGRLVDDLPVARVVRDAEYGGGPGPGSVAAQRRRLHERWAAHVRTQHAWRDTRRGRAAELDKAVAAVLGEAGYGRWVR
jgi:argininosuccinate lyase